MLDKEESKQTNGLLPIASGNNTNDTKVSKGTDNSVSHKDHINFVNVMMVGYQEKFLTKVADCFLIRDNMASSGFSYESDTVYTKDGIVSVKLLLYTGKPEDKEKQSLHLQQADGIVFFYDMEIRESFD